MQGSHRFIRLSLVFGNVELFRMKKHSLITSHVWVDNKYDKPLGNFGLLRDMKCIVGDGRISDENLV